LGWRPLPSRLQFSLLGGLASDWHGAASLANCLHIEMKATLRRIMQTRDSSLQSSKCQTHAGGRSSREYIPMPPCTAGEAVELFISRPSSDGSEHALASLEVRGGRPFLYTSSTAACHSDSKIGGSSPPQIPHSLCGYATTAQTYRAYLGQLKPLRRDARSPAFRRWPVPARRHAVLSMFCACLSPSGIFGPPPQPFSVFPACPVHNHLGGKEMCSEQPTQWLRCVLATSRRPAGPSR